MKFVDVAGTAEAANEQPSLFGDVPLLAVDGRSLEVGAWSSGVESAARRATIPHSFRH
jgi:hypothetical protein